MDESYYIELMHKAIDGLIDAQERGELDSYLSKHPQAKSDFAELQAMAYALDVMPPEAPATELKQNILAALPADHYPNARKAAAPPHSWRRWLDSGNRRLMYGFAAGLLAGILLFTLFVPPDGSGLRPDALIGTLVLPEYTPGEQSGIIDVQAVSGSYRLVPSATTNALELILTSPGKLHIDIRFSPRELRLKGMFSGQQPLENLTTGDGQIAIIHNATSRHTLLFQRLTASGSTLQLSLSFNGEPVFSTDIHGQTSAKR